jgi:outer membrane receptor protein involved in Fe transport
VQGSIIEKYVGVRYGDSPDLIRLGGYGTADAAVNYFFRPSSDMALKNAKIGLTMQNLTNRKSIYFFDGYTNSGAPPPPGSPNGFPLFFTLPGRSFQVNLSASF